MGHFSAALRTAMDSAGWDQQTLSEKTRAVSQSRLSKYLLRGDLPKPGTLEEICKVFDPRVREDLTNAYLTDQIPPSARNLVGVVALRDGKEARPKFVPGRAPEGSILRADLDYLEAEALGDPNLAKMFNYLAASRRGVRPHPDYYEPEDNSTLSVMEDPLVVAAQKKLAGEEDSPGENAPQKAKRRKKS